VGSGPICSTIESGDCTNDVNPHDNTFLIFEQATLAGMCSLAPSVVSLWFAAGPPAPGSYDVQSASSDNDVHDIGNNMVIVSIASASSGTTDTWWATAGRLVVESLGGDLSFTFQNLDASDGTAPTVLAGHLLCTPP
jgi:hypothetical protein